MRLLIQLISGYEMYYHLDSKNRYQSFAQQSTDEVAQSIDLSENVLIRLKKRYQSIAQQSVNAVSYTHLTLPTNREV